MRRRRLLLGVLGAGLAVSAAGAGPGPAPAQPASAILLKAEAGDRACYMTLRDDRGATVEAYADFDICERASSLLGRRVEFTWEMINLPAPDCGAEPGCPRSERVPVAVRARLAAAPAVKPGSLCTTSETVVFACQAGARTVSVCAAPGAGGDKVQYRIGRPGGSPDLVLPEAPGRPRDVATGDTLMFSGGGGAWLRFANGPFAYTVYSAIGRWGPGGAPAEKAGVLVEKGGERVANLRCTGGEAALDAGWMSAAGVRPDARGFDLP
jgi:hypothetical protein